MRRSSALLGFTGVELGVLAALKPDQFANVHGGVWIFALVLISLFLSFGSLVLAVRDKPFEYPSLAKLDWVLKNDSVDSDQTLYELVLNLEDPSKSTEANLIRENGQISHWFSIGVRIAGFAQLILAVLLFLRWKNYN